MSFVRDDRESLDAIRRLWFPVVTLALCAPNLAALGQGFEQRRDQLLDQYATGSTTNLYAQLCCLATDRTPNEAPFQDALDMMDGRIDTADFRLSAILRMLYQFGESPPLSQALLDRVSKVMGEVARLRIEEVSFRDLLKRMGWKNQAPVIKYGAGANPNDFRAQAPEGIRRTSGGSVSDLFKERRPPAKKSSAY